MLIELAQAIIKLDKNPNLLTLIAIKAAERADDLNNKKDGRIAETLAAAYLASGNVKTAIEIQERAIRLAKGTPHEQNPVLAKQLAVYKAAAILR